MEKKTKSVSSEQDHEEFKEYVLKTDVNELCDHVKTKILQANFLTFLNSLLGVLAKNGMSELKRRRVMETTLTALQSAPVTNNHANAIVYRFIIDFPQYSSAHLIKLMDYCLESMQANNDDFTSWKDLIPQILEVLQGRQHISYDGSEISGNEYKETVLKALCSTKSPPEVLISLTAMFCEISMSKEEHQRVVTVLCDRLSDIKLNEIPPLVHQILTLCRDRHGSLLTIALSKYFAQRYDEVSDNDSEEMSENIGVLTSKEIQESESTVLYHITQAVQLNHSSIKEYIRLLRNVTNVPEYILDPFLMTMLMNVSNVYENETIDILRLSISRKIRDDELRQESACVKEVLSEEWNVMGVIYNVIQKSVQDRHLVVKGLIELSLTLLGTGMKPADEAHTTAIRDLGNKILQKLIKQRSDIGRFVLQTLTERILTASTVVHRYTNYLAYMCRKVPLVMLDCKIWITTLLEQLPAMNGTTATQVIYAVVPLVRISRIIRDSMCMVLRKSMYSKKIETRQMAVAGFLQLLQNLKIDALGTVSQTESCGNSTESSASVFTQVHLEVHTRRADQNPKLNTLLCHEILGVLKRCFTQQADIKLHLYAGLYDVVLTNPEVSIHLVDMLLAQFDHYCVSDENILPPFRLEKCTSIHGAESVLQEPIGHLVFVMQHIYIRAATINSPGIDKLGFILESLCKRMAKCELEHFGLDDGIDLLDNLPECQEKLLCLKQMMTAYEALIAYRILSWMQDSAKPAQKIYRLFEGYNRLATRLKFGNKNKKADTTKRKVKDAKDTTIKKSSRVGVVTSPPTILDPEIVSKILSVLYSKSVPWTTTSEADQLRGKEPFHRYVLRICIEIIQKTKQLRNIELQNHKSQYMRKYYEIGHILYTDIVSNLEEIRNFDEQTALYGVECFKELCELFCTQFSSKLLEFLTHAGDEDSNASLDIILARVVSTLKSLLVVILAEEEDETAISKKFPSIIMETISLLASKFPHDSKNITELLDWLYELATEREVETTLAVTVVQLIFTIEDRMTDYGKSIDQIAQQFSHTLGTIRGDAQSMDENFKILNEKSAYQLHITLCNMLKHKLNNTKWLVSRIKAEQLLANMPGSDVTRKHQLKSKERVLGCQLCHIAQTLRTLTNVSIPPGVNSDAVFNNLQQFYSVLSAFTKHFYSKSTPQNPAFQAVGFVPLIKLAGKPLAKNLYQLITHIEKNQNLNVKAKGSNAYARRSKILKETRLIPKVIYEVEQFGKNVLLLSKKTKINFDDYIQYSITRDFKINNPALIEGLETLDATLLSTQTSSHDGTDADGDTSQNRSGIASDDENDVSTSPSAKRSRIPRRSQE